MVEIKPNKSNFLTGSLYYMQINTTKTQIQAHWPIHFKGFVCVCVCVCGMGGATYSWGWRGWVGGLHFFNILAVVPSTVILLQCLLQGWHESIRLMWTELQEKTENNPFHQKNWRKHYLMVIVLKKLNVNKICR